MQSRYLSYLSHDLRNNLNAVTLMLQGLGQSLEGALEVFEAAGARWIHVVDLDAARSGEAEQWYERAVSAGNANATFNLGLLHYRLGDFTKAARPFEKALALAPSRAAT